MKNSNIILTRFSACSRQESTKIVEFADGSLRNLIIHRLQQSNSFKVGIRATKPSVLQSDMSDDSY